MIDKRRDKSGLSRCRGAIPLSIYIRDGPNIWLNYIIIHKKLPAMETKFYSFTYYQSFLFKGINNLEIDFQTEKKLNLARYPDPAF